MAMNLILQQISINLLSILRHPNMQSLQLIDKENRTFLAFDNQYYFWFHIFYWIDRQLKITADHCFQFMR